MIKIYLNWNEDNVDWLNEERTWPNVYDLIDDGGGNRNPEEYYELLYQQQLESLREQLLREYDIKKQQYNQVHCLNEIVRKLINKKITKVEFKKQIKQYIIKYNIPPQNYDRLLFELKHKVKLHSNKLYL